MTSGANDDIRLGGLAVREFQPRSNSILFEADAAMTSTY
jgi:hypothetical protein